MQLLTINFPPKPPHVLVTYFSFLVITHKLPQVALAWYRRGSPHKCIRCWLTKDKDRKVSKSVHFCVSERRVCIHQVRRLPIITAKAVMVLPCIAAILSLLLYHYECVDVFVCVCLTMLCLARVDPSRILTFHSGTPDTIKLTCLSCADQPATTYTGRDPLVCVWVLN